MNRQEQHTVPIPVVLQARHTIIVNTRHIGLDKERMFGYNIPEQMS